MRVGFIGCGNMGQAMLVGMLESGKVDSDSIIVYDKVEDTKALISTKYGVKLAKSNKEVVKEADLIFLAVKPLVYELVLEEIKNDIKRKFLCLLHQGKPCRGWKIS